MATTEERTREEVRQLLDSGDWWVLVDTGKSTLPGIIESRHYAGATEDFRLILGPDLAGQHVSFFAMRRGRMSAQDLAAALAEAGGDLLPAVSYEKRRLLFSPRGEAPTALILAVYDWLRL